MQQPLFDVGIGNNQQLLLTAWLPIQPRIRGVDKLAVVGLCHLVQVHSCTSTSNASVKSNAINADCTAVWFRSIASKVPGSQGFPVGLFRTWKRALPSLAELDVNACHGSLVESNVLIDVVL
jgi:hypothetical protein